MLVVFLKINLENGIVLQLGADGLEITGLEQDIMVIRAL